LSLFLPEIELLNEQSIAGSKVHDEDAIMRMKDSLQFQMAQQKGDDETRVLKDWMSTRCSDAGTLDHSYSHHVDYRAIAEYESH
jgi:hypothetical protein